MRKKNEEPDCYDTLHYYYDYFEISVIHLDFLSFNVSVIMNQ